MSIQRGSSTLVETLGPEYDLATWFERELASLHNPDNPNCQCRGCEVLRYFEKR